MGKSWKNGEAITNTYKEIIKKQNNMMKKFLLMMLFCVTQIVAWGQIGTYGTEANTATISADGSTLKIKGKGDLATIEQSVPVSTTTFTDAAVGNVFTSDAGAAVTNGMVYNAANQYYTANRTWNQLFDGGVPTTDGNYARSIYSTRHWDVAKITAANTYIYPAYLGNSDTQWDATSAFLYKIGAPTTGDKWTTSALTADGVYIYPVELGSATSTWNEDKVAGKNFSIWYKDWQGKPAKNSSISATGAAIPSYDYGNISYNETTYSQYCYTTKDWSSITDMEEAVSNGDVVLLTIEQLESFFDINTPLTVSADRLVSGSYSAPGNFTYNDVTYVKYILSSVEIAENVTLSMESLPATVTLLTSMDSYHANATTVHIDQRITTGYEPYYDGTSTFTYNDVSYLYYASSDNELVVGTDYDIESVNLLTNVDEYRPTKYPIVVDRSKRVTTEAYENQNNITYNGDTYLGYIVSSVEWPSTTVYVGDPNVQLMTETYANDTYMSSTIKYTACDNLYRGNNETKSLLTSGTEYTYVEGDLFYTPAETTYTAISNNETFFAANASYLHTDTDTEILTFAEILANAVTSGAYTDVVFEKDGADVVITPAISQAILYQNKAQNPTVKTLDLGETTITTLADAFVGKDQHGNAIAQTVLTTLVLPSGNQAEVGTNDLKFTSLNALTTLDVSKANLSDNDAKKIQGYRDYEATVNIIEKDGYTVDQLASRYGTTSNGKLGIYSKVSTEPTTETDAYIYANTANISDYISGASNVVVGGPANVNAALLAEAEKCEGIVNLVLAKMNGLDSNPFASFTNTKVKRVILPDGTNVNTLSKLSTGCPIYQSYDSSTRKETILMTNAGDLGAIKDYHYYSTDIDNAYWIEVEGNINAADIAFLNGINNDRLNLSRATNAAGDESALRTAMHGFENQNVKYLAWPVFSTDPSDPLYADIRSACPSLIAVGQFVRTNDPAEQDGKLVAYTTQEGKIKEITDMLAEVTKKNGSGNANVLVKHAKVSGNLAAVDIFAGGPSNSKLGIDGHMYLSPAVDEYAYTQTRTMGPATENGETITSGAFDGCNGLVSIDLSDAVFTHFEDMTLSKLNIIGAPTESVKIPTSNLVTQLPADFVNADGNQIHEIMIPSNIQRIHARAFAASDLRHVWTNNTTTEEKCDNGATYELAEDNLVSYTDAEYKGLGEKPAKTKLVYGTYTFSENLKFIGTNVFGGSTRIHDVYMLGTQAPVCCVNAFSTESYVANNSYQAEAVTDKIDRDKYANAKYVWMTVLHFPAKCTTNQAKLYTDVTRQYSIASDERDGRGKIIYYPTMCEWNRSFTQGTTGYLWNAYGAERNGLSGTAMGFYNNAAAKNAKNAMNDCYMTSRSQEDYQNTANGLYSASDNTQKISSVFYNTASNNYTALSYDKDLYNADYRGWHQFVLADYGYSDDYVYDFNDFSDNNWWTICEPFSLTAKEMKAAFGDDVDLRKLISVTRDIAGQHITLNFDKNHLTDAADNDVILEAGVPYMIKPSIDDRSNPDHMVLHFEKNHDNDARFAPKSGEQLINLLNAGKYTVPAYVINNTGDYREPVADVKVNGKDVHKHLEYTMVGTFFQYHFPLYCYFLGWNSSLNGGKGGVQFFWNNKLDKVNRSWNPYTAIIVPHIKGDMGFYQPKGEFETIHYIYDAQERFGDTDDYCDINSAETYTQSAGEAKRNLVSTVLEFNYEEGNNATGIDNVVKTNPYLNNKVYNMNGQLINNGNNNQRIAKGVYISNGKKFIVK